MKIKRKVAIPVVSLSLVAAPSFSIATAENSEPTPIIVSTVEIPYNTRIVEDSFLPEGVEVLVQEGSLGKEDTVRFSEKTFLPHKEPTFYEQKIISVAPSEKVIRRGVNTENTISGVDEHIASIESAKIAELERQKHEELLRSVNSGNQQQVTQPQNQIQSLPTSGGVNAHSNPGRIVDATANGITTPAENKEFLRSITSQEEFRCADILVMKESGYVTTATNPSSGAYGVAQSLPAGKYASHGSDWQTNGKTQILWMKDYVHGRYGGWCNALNFHYSNNWY